MTAYARLPLVVVDPQILSSYEVGTGNTAVTILRDRLLPLYKRDSGRAPRSMSDMLTALDTLVRNANGDLRITDLYRSYAVQASARARYDNWLKAGKPKTTSPLYNPATMKNVYVARPGYSFHNSGRAIDIHIQALRFKGVPDNQQLDKFWMLAAGLGFKPVISQPTEGAAEGWHFDFLGEWGNVLDRLDYASTAMCAALDVGQWADYDRPEWRFVQAQLHRAGYDVGQVDGIAGKKTSAGLLAAKISYSSDPTTLFASVSALPSSHTKWVYE